MNRMHCTWNLPADGAEQPELDNQDTTIDDGYIFLAKLRQEALQEVQTVRDHAQKSFQEEFRQEQTTT